MPDTSLLKLEKALLILLEFTSLGCHTISVDFSYSSLQNLDSYRLSMSEMDHLQLVDLLRHNDHLCQEDDFLFIKMIIASETLFFTPILEYPVCP